MEKLKIILLVALVLLGLFSSYLIFKYFSLTNTFSFFTPKRQIVIDSKIEGYRLSAKDQDKLYNELTTIGFWKDNGVANFNIIEKRFTAKALKITLVPQVSDGFLLETDPKNKAKITEASAKVTPDGEVIIDISVEDPAYLQNKEQIEGLFDYAYWMSVYIVSKYKNISTDQIDNGEADRFATERVKKDRFFIIDKI